MPNRPYRRFGQHSPFVCDYYSFFHGPRRRPKKFFFLETILVVFWMRGSSAIAADVEAFLTYLSRNRQAKVYIQRSLSRCLPFRF